MSEAFLVTDEVDESFGTPTNDEAPLVCHEPGCTNPVVKPARGRTPKFCPEHKSGSRSNTTKSKASGKSWPRAVEIETHLSNTITTLGGLTGHFYDATDGELIQEHGPKIIHELVELAKDDKNLQRWLIWLSAPGKYGPLASSVMALAVPLYLNHAVKNAAKRAAMEQEREV